MPRVTTGPSRTFSIRTGLIRLIAVTLAIALLLFQTGCAKQPRPYCLPPPLSEDARAGMGTIGVVSAEFVPETKFFAHSRGRVSGAAEGMAFDVAGESVPLLWFPTGSAPSGPVPPGAAAGYGAAVLLGLIAVGLLVGEAYRAATAVPAEEVEETGATLRRALTELRVQESYRERFFQTAAEQVPSHFVLIEQGGPKTTDEMPTYGYLKEMGIDTVVELGVLSIGFQGTGGEDPLLSLLLNAKTRVVSAPGGTVLYENVLQYRSVKRTFTEWIKDNGKVFSEELDRSYGTLSEKVVEELFLRVDLPPR